MKKTIFALAAVLMTSGASFAMDNTLVRTFHDAAPASVVVNPPKSLSYSGTAGIGATETGIKNNRYGDAAPSSVVVSPPRSLDYSGTAGIGATPNGFKNNRYGDGANSMY